MDSAWPKRSPASDPPLMPSVSWWSDFTGVGTLLAFRSCLRICMPPVSATVPMASFGMPIARWFGEPATE